MTCNYIWVNDYGMGGRIYPQRCSELLEMLRILIHAFIHLQGSGSGPSGRLGGRLGEFVPVDVFQPRRGVVTSAWFGPVSLVHHNQVCHTSFTGVQGGDSALQTHREALGDACNTLGEAVQL